MATLLAAYAFAETNGVSTVADATGNGHTGTLSTTSGITFVAGPTSVVAGSKAVRFSAVAQRIRIERTGLEPAGSTGGVTTMFWYFMPASGAVDSNPLGPLIKQRAGDSTRHGVYLNPLADDGQAIARWNNQLIIQGVAYTRGTWTHFCLTDGPTEWTVYIDGVQAGTGTRSDGTTNNSWEDYPWTIGATVGALCESNVGMCVSMPRIFSGILTQSEVQTYRTTAIGGASPVDAIQVGRTSQAAYAGRTGATTGSAVLLGGQGAPAASQSRAGTLLGAATFPGTSTTSPMASRTGSTTADATLSGSSAESTHTDHDGTFTADAVVLGTSACTATTSRSGSTRADSTVTGNPSTTASVARDGSVTASQVVSATFTGTSATGSIVTRDGSISSSAQMVGVYARTSTSTPSGTAQSDGNATVFVGTSVQVTVSVHSGGWSADATSLGYRSSTTTRSRSGTPLIRTYTQHFERIKVRNQTAAAVYVGNQRIYP